MKRILVLMMAALGSTVALADSVWQWSNSGQYYYYRDNDGRVHYSDGSVSGANTVWVDNGMVVYSANSVGPKDKTGVWAIQAPKIDESKVGPAPTSPPANAVLTMPDPTEANCGPSTNRTSIHRPNHSQRSYSTFHWWLRVEGQSCPCQHHST